MISIRNDNFVVSYSSCALTGSRDLATQEKLFSLLNLALKKKLTKIYGIKKVCYIILYTKVNVCMCTCTVRSLKPLYQKAFLMFFFVS